MPAKEREGQRAWKSIPAMLNSGHETRDTLCHVKVSSMVENDLLRWKEM